MFRTYGSYLVVLRKGDGLRVCVGGQLPHALHEVRGLVAAQHREVLAGQQVQTRRARDQRLRNCQTVLATNIFARYINIF